MIQILLIDDDTELAELIRANLPQIGFPTKLDAVTDGASGLSSASTGNYDLILLDITLPELDGFSICEQLRTQGLYTPLVILTGKEAEADRIRGIELGADDYLVKPVGIPELIARIRALLRRSKIDPLSENAKEATQEISVGPLRLDTSGRRVWLNDSEISLSRSEFELLQMLISNPGKLFSRQELLEQVWGYTSDSYAHVLNPHITRLRKKIEKDPANPQLLITDWGKGYRFVAPDELESEID